MLPGIPGTQSDQLGPLCARLAISQDRHVHRFCQRMRPGNCIANRHRRLEAELPGACHITDHNQCRLQPCSRRSLLSSQQVWYCQQTASHNTIPPIHGSHPVLSPRNSTCEQMVNRQNLQVPMAEAHSQSRIGILPHRHHWIEISATVSPDHANRAAAVSAGCFPPRNSLSPPAQSNTPRSVTATPNSTDNARLHQS